VNPHEPQTAFHFRRPSSGEARGWHSSGRWIRSGASNRYARSGAEPAQSLVSPQQLEALEETR